MTSSAEPPDDPAVRRGMESLILAMRRRRLVTTATVPEAPRAEIEDGQLAEVARRALEPARSRDCTGTGRELGHGGSPCALGTSLGRYLVLRPLGAGGMGVVYEGHDPQLERTVALKLVRPDRMGNDGRRRLLREAQALAKLSHRNVVAIFDVGTRGDDVWLAMELVDGQTLRQWLDRPRPWREVVGVLCEAGRGLAAAHAAGLLHRDFKPDNVMIGRDGRVRVMDFGLAQARASPITLETEAIIGSRIAGVDALGSRITETEAFVGTPVYMAPEQFQGVDLTPAVDQFALCVTLWEALHGQRPFDAPTLEALREDVAAGRLRAPSTGRAAPRWLRRVCTKGLSAAPQHRFESMEALLDALARGQARARVRGVVIAMGALTALAAGAEGARRYDLGRRTDACEASGSEIEVAWDSERRGELRRALRATGASQARTTGEKVIPWLNEQAERWRQARVEACMDAEVRGRWDEPTYERARWCLDERRIELEALVDELTLADDRALRKAVKAAAGLPAIEPCRDERVLAALGLPPKEGREAVRSIREDVTRAFTLERAGRYDEGLAVAHEVLQRAEALRWAPLVAAARMRLGSLLARTGAHTEAETVLVDAYFEALESTAPDVAVDAATSLVHVVGIIAVRPAEGQAWARHAEAALASVRDDARLRQARVLSALAGVRWTAGDYDEARMLCERALALEQEVLGPMHPDVAADLAGLALIHLALGLPEEAELLHERALSIREHALGPEHPDVAKSLGGLANAHYVMDAYEEARLLHERALFVLERARGPEHLDVATAQQNLASVLFSTGAYEEARMLHERALQTRERVLGPDHPVVATSLSGLALVLGELGLYADARSLHERALEVRERVLGPGHPDVAKSLEHLALLELTHGVLERGLRLGERALEIRERALGREHPDVVHTLGNLAALHRAAGNHDQAQVLQERARATRVPSAGRGE